jgi:hypothetical protein
VLVARAGRIPIAPAAAPRHVPGVFVRRLAALPVALA